MKVKTETTPAPGSELELNRKMSGLIKKLTKQFIENISGTNLQWEYLKKHADAKVIEPFSREQVLYCYQEAFKIIMMNEVKRLNKILK